MHSVTDLYTYRLFRLFNCLCLSVTPFSRLGGASSAFGKAERQFVAPNVGDTRNGVTERGGRNSEGIYTGLILLAKHTITLESPSTLLPFMIRCD